MTDFLPWLYRHYIRPCQEEHIDGSPYEMSLALMESDLAPEDRRHFEALARAACPELRFRVWRGPAGGRV